MPAISLIDNYFVFGFIVFHGSFAPYLFPIQFYRWEVAYIPTKIAVPVITKRLALGLYPP